MPFSTYREQFPAMPPAVSSRAWLVHGAGHAWSGEARALVHRSKGRTRPLELRFFSDADRRPSASAALGLPYRAALRERLEANRFRWLPAAALPCAAAHHLSSTATFAMRGASRAPRVRRSTAGGALRFGAGRRGGDHGAVRWYSPARQRVRDAPTPVGLDASSLQMANC